MNKKRLLAMLVAGTMVVGSAAALAGCGDGNKITVWVSETEGVKTLTESQINDFIAQNEEYKGKYKIVVEGVGEGDAATNMITDVSSGADIFCYAQDQMARLIEAKALSTLGTASAKFVQDNNDEDAVSAVTVGGKVYSYPLTSDNTYFMYYDKSVIKEESLGDLAAIVKDCQDAKPKCNFSYELGGSAWYTASFFFGAGCTSTWSFDTETNKWKAADDFNSPNGLIALKGIQILTASGVWVDSSSVSDFNAATHSAVVVSGSWGANEAKEILGNNYAAAPLPKYTVDGKAYQLKPFSGVKLMGVKPQTDDDRNEFCHKLAQYLTGEKCQLKRLEKFSWGPSNKAAAASELAQNSDVVNAIKAQADFSVVQGQIHGGWWDIAKLLGSKTIDGGDQTKPLDAAGLQGLLDDYQTSINKFETMSVEAMEAFGVVGKIASLEGATDNLAEGQTEWADWGADVKMNKTENADKSVTWKSVIKVTLAAGDEFQVRQGQSWDTQYGAVGDDGYSTKSNFVITDANAGEYYIVLNVKDGKGVVSLSAN